MCGCWRWGLGFFSFKREGRSGPLNVGYDVRFPKLIQTGHAFKRRGLGVHNLLCILVPFSIMMWQFQKTFIMVNLWKYSKRVSGVLQTLFLSCQSERGRTREMGCSNLVFFADSYLHFFADPSGRWGVLINGRCALEDTPWRCSGLGCVGRGQREVEAAPPHLPTQEPSSSCWPSWCCEIKRATVGQEVMERRVYFDVESTRW